MSAILNTQIRPKLSYKTAMLREKFVFIVEIYSMGKTRLICVQNCI